MTIEQANAYFSALPEGFAPARQLRSRPALPRQAAGAVLGVAGTAGQDDHRRPAAAILQAAGLSRASTMQAVSRSLPASGCRESRWPELLVTGRRDPERPGDPAPSAAAELAAAARCFWRGRL